MGQGKIKSRASGKGQKIMGEPGSVDKFCSCER